MLKDSINSMIAKAMKEKDEQKKEAYRAIKNAFLQYETSKNAKPLTDVEEINILKKLVKEREESAALYENNNRKDLAEVENTQAMYIKELMPRVPSRSDLEIVLVGMYDSAYPKIDKKDMGKVIKSLKEKYPAADGKLIADIVKAHIV